MGARQLSKDPHAAKGLLQHSNVSTTERHYIKGVPEHALEAMKQLEALCKDCAKVGDHARANRLRELG
jgi:hypothetical protein